MVKGQEIEVFTYKPKTYVGERMIMVLHGTLRNADEYRNDARAMGDRFGALIVAPKFDEKRFPSLKYQRGGILREDGTAAPSSEWTYGYIPEIYAQIKRLEKKPALRYWIIGHSAGGQFVLRMAGFEKTGAERLVSANPGSDLFPTRDMPFGYGFGNLPDALSNDRVIRDYLAQPLTLYLGSADNGPDEYFDDSPEAIKQGPGRFQRGMANFEFAKSLAKQKGWTFGWTLVKAPGVIHDHTAMFNHPACERALFNGYLH
jgi:pimeloyl-ACP methyl ester carboxylesterase